MCRQRSLSPFPLADWDPLRSVLYIFWLGGNLDQNLPMARQQCRRKTSIVWIFFKICTHGICNSSVVKEVIWPNISETEVYVGLACMSSSPRKNSRKDICHPGGADVQVGQLWQNVEPDTDSAFRLFIQGAPVSAVGLHLGHYWWRADSGEHSLQMSVGWRSMLETTFLPLLFQHGVFFIFFPPPSLLLHIFSLKEYFSSAAVGSLFITCLNTVKL